MAWMDHYVRGQGRKFAWRGVLKTLEDDAEAEGRQGDRRRTLT
jgi:hypothetical protein